MHHLFLSLVFSAFGALASGALFSNDTSSIPGAGTSSVNVRWLDGVPAYTTGTTFGLPWPQGRLPANSTTFSAKADGGSNVDIQSWITAYWPDGTVKWSGHAVPVQDSYPNSYSVTASLSQNRRVRKRSTENLDIKSTNDAITVNTGKLTAIFPKSGNSIVSKLVTASGKTVGQNGKLVLRTQSTVANDYESADSISYTRFESKISSVTVDTSSTIRALVTVNGTHSANSGASHDDWLPFTIRFYLYAGSEAIRIIHTIVFDGDSAKDFITGLGLKFEVPLAGEKLYDRHIRFTSSEGGVLSEAVQGITGLRRDPGEAVRNDQVQGKKLPDASTWDQRVTTRLKWIPPWGDYSLRQLTADGFTLQKRTKGGQSWVKIPAGGRAGGLAYLGGPTVGGLAVSLRDFWERYPTGLDISNAATDTGSITLWLYSPDAQPLDIRPYHDGLGLTGNYTAQLDALEITYEDWEENYNTPFGVARTNEIFLHVFEETPSADFLTQLTSHTKAPPVLAAEGSYIQETAALGTYWDSNDGANTTEIDKTLDFLYSFYKGQISDHKWYGFWDYGDIMHSYDPDRHTWRYDVGGYSWDNSELSPDLFFWLYFLRRGSGDIYRFSETHTRHTFEVDVYHLGKYVNTGTRHGVQHWGDSAKQIRISTPQYRKYYYYLSGGDERTGEIIHRMMDADAIFVEVDATRKVRENKDYVPDPTALDIGLGTDWSGLAAVWLIEYERRGPRWQEALMKLQKTMAGIGALKNGFVTGSGLYNMYTGTLIPPGADSANLGVVAVSHLSAMFGLIEVVSELIDTFGDDIPKGFKQAWLDYCYYYGAPKAEQKARYGVDFGNVSLKQGHSRLTAYAANKTENATLGARAWNEFFNSDGFKATDPWATELINGSSVFSPIREAEWVSTNSAALYGLAAIQNLALVKQWKP